LVQEISMNGAIPQFSLHGRKALITGATGHLGRAMTLALAGCGAHVLVNSRSGSRAAALAEEVRASGGSASVLVFDITDAQQVRTELEQVDSPVHVLINNAYGGGAGSLSQVTPQAYRDSYEVGLVAAHILVQATLPALREAVRRDGDASVINIASMYGLVSPDPRVYDSPSAANPPFYGAAKAALLQWTRYAACEFGPEGIRFNSISPGPFPSELVCRDNPRFVARLAGKVPLGRTGSADEITGPVVFLAARASSFVNGANLVVDGGWTAW
jgi:NAD(P)-dependent dehydrogenase (short-subunit alcohol dehydrogenase family)